MSKEHDSPSSTNLLSNLKQLPTLQTEDSTPIDGFTTHQVFIAHFTQALTIAQKILSLDEKYLAIQSIINKLPIGIIVIDSDLTVFQMTELGNQLIDNKQLLQISKKRLVCKSKTVLRHLTAGIEDLANNFSGQDNTKSLLIPKDELQDQVVAVIYPILSTEPDLPKNLYVIFFSSRRSLPIPNLSDFQLDHKLGKREIQIAHLIVKNYWTNEIAQHNKVKISTIRTQVKSILSEAGLRSKAEIVSIVLSSPGTLLRNGTQQLESRQEVSPIVISNIHSRTAYVHLYYQIGDGWVISNMATQKVIR